MKKEALYLTIFLGFGALMTYILNTKSDKEGQYISRELQNTVSEEANSAYFDIMRKNVQSGKVEANDYLKAIEQVSTSRNARATQLNWEFMGPDNIGGRVRAIVVDNANGNRIYSGGAGGGMYISTDGAGTWTYKSDDWENIHVSTIAQDANGRLYAGTGMYADAGASTGNGSAFPGGGIYVSDDRGETWSHLSSTKPAPHTTSDEWAYINRIAVSKTKNAQGNYTVYAGTRNGLKVSLDKGQTWTEPMTLPNCVNPLPGNVQDVVTTHSGRVLVSYNGSLYFSDDGETTCTYNLVGVANGIGGSTRMSIAVCSSDENNVYAFQSFANSGGNPATFQILKSTNGGRNWGPLNPAPPTAVIDSTFDLMGVNPASYNQAITVDPVDCDKIYVGAVQLYQVDGAWNSVSTTFNNPGTYVHADVHWFVFDPNNSNTMYVGTDGGVGKTTNAGSGNIDWTENNRHFGTTQYYGIATSTGGQVMGGTQDNGSHLLDPTLVGPAAKDGLSVYGNDGFDCAISNMGDVGFATSQYGLVARGSYQNPGQGGIIHPMGTGSTSPFYTVLQEWESKNDMTSKDSVVFTNDTSRFSIGTGDGNKKLYTGTLRRLQSSAEIIPGQVRFEDIAGGQIATDSDVQGVLKSFGDSVGIIDYNTGAYSIRWSFAPPVGSSVNSIFNVSYDVGDTIMLISQNQGVNFPYVLTSGLSTTDSVKVQDPVQSLLVVSMNGGFNITREALYFPLQMPTWVNISSTTPSCFEFSEDGNHLYIGGYNGRVTRISGLNDFYMDVNPNDVLTKTDIYSGASAVSGICIHPSDPEKILVTTGGYGVANHVYELTAAQSSSGLSPNRNLQGDLPDFPVYDPEYNVNKPEQVVLGTELGVWYSEDVSGASPTWTQQSTGVGNVPVMDVRQQRLSYDEALNYGRFYIGTFGRGIWTSGDLVSVGDNDNWADFNDNTEISNVKLYPNPVSMVSKLTFDMPANGSVDVMIYDISGKVIRSEKKNFAKGNVSYEINSLDMPAGTYFVSLRSGDFVKQAKFVVVK